jgi:hypothetical protein
VSAVAVLLSKLHARLLHFLARSPNKSCSRYWYSKIEANTMIRNTVIVATLEIICNFIIIKIFRRGSDNTINYLETKYILT